MKRTQRCANVEDLIAYFLRSGKSYSYICDVLHTSPKRVSRVNKEMKQNGQIPPPLPLGRPQKINQNVCNYIEEQTNENPRISCKQIKSDMLETMNIQVSKSFIAYTRHQLGFIYTQPRKRQALTKDHIEKRLKFCCEQLENLHTHTKAPIVASRFTLAPIAPINESTNDKKRLNLHKSVGFNWF